MMSGYHDSHNSYHNGGGHRQQHSTGIIARHHRASSSPNHNVHVSRRNSRERSYSPSKHTPTTLKPSPHRLVLNNQKKVQDPQPEFSDISDEEDEVKQAPMAVDGISDVSDDEQGESNHNNNNTNNYNSNSSSATGNADSVRKENISSEQTAIKTEPNDNSKTKTAHVAHDKSKEYWLQQMNKTDNEIAAVTHELALFADKRKAILSEIELENKARLQDIKQEKKSGGSLDLIHGTVTAANGTEDAIKRIYAENRAKAAQMKLHHTNNTVPLLEPKFRQNPSELPAVQRVCEQYKGFEPKLVKQLSYWKKQDLRLQHDLAKEYLDRYKVWKKKLASYLKTNKVVNAENKRKALFEKEFPSEQRKIQRLANAQQRALQRGDNALHEALRRSLDPSSNVSVDEASAGTDNEIFQGHPATVEPMMLGNERKLAGRLRNNNGFVADSMKTHQELEHINVWTEEEKKIFFDRYMMYPKKFMRIATSLPNKTTADCVKFYYLTKKQAKYKEKREEIRRIKAQQRKKKNQQASNAYRAIMTGSGTASPVPHDEETDDDALALPTFDSALNVEPKARKPTFAEQEHARRRAAQGNDPADGKASQKLKARAKGDGAKQEKKKQKGGGKAKKSASRDSENSEHGRSQSPTAPSLEDTKDGNKRKRGGASLGKGEKKAKKKKDASSKDGPTQNGVKRKSSAKQEKKPDETKRKRRKKPTKSEDNPSDAKKSKLSSTESGRRKASQSADSLASTSASESKGVFQNALEAQDQDMSTTPPHDPPTAGSDRQPTSSMVISTTPQGSPPPRKVNRTQQQPSSMSETMTITTAMAVPSTDGAGATTAATADLGSHTPPPRDAPSNDTIMNDAGILATAAATPPPPLHSNSRLIAETTTPEGSPPRK